MLTPFSQIVVTTHEYYAIGFTFSILGMLYTMHNMFLAPHERESDVRD